MKSTLLITVVALLGLVQPLTAAQPPNIVFLLADDLGFMDVGAKDLKTSHLDALALSGVVARHGYSTAPQCVPSRGGLMTGKFHGRFGLDNNGSALDGFDKETTIAARLQREGYSPAE